MYARSPPVTVCDMSTTLRTPQLREFERVHLSTSEPYANITNNLKLELPL